MIGARKWGELPGREESLRIDQDRAYLSTKETEKAVSAALIAKTVTANGEYDPAGDGADGYKSVTVAVPNTYAADDEGKVVSSGALVSQASDTVTANDTYDTTLINSLTVNVSGGGGGGITLLDSGTYTKANPGGTMTIPVSLTGTPVAVLVECDAATSGMAQSLGWAFTNTAAFPDWSTKATFTALADGPGVRNVWVDLANDNQQFAAGTSALCTVDTSSIVVKRPTSSYTILAGTYNWYIWGV